MAFMGSVLSIHTFGLEKLVIVQYTLQNCVPCKIKTSLMSPISPWYPSVLKLPDIQMNLQTEIVDSK